MTLLCTRALALPRTSKAQATLSEAESSLFSALESASEALRALSSVDSTKASPFDRHAESFINKLGSVQEIVRTQIAQVGRDLPLENGSMRKLVEADLAAQQTRHSHAAVREALKLLTEDAPDAEATGTVGATTTHENAQDSAEPPDLAAVNMELE